MSAFTLYRTLTGAEKRVLDMTRREGGTTVRCYASPYPWISGSRVGNLPTGERLRVREYGEKKFAVARIAPNGSWTFIR